MDVMPVTTDVDSRASLDGDGSAALVEAAIEGDTDAFDRLVRHRLPRTWRLARAILGTDDDAGDACQEAWLAVWRQLPALRDTTRFDAWLDRIVVNACRMSVRRRGRVREIHIGDEFDPASKVPGPDHVAERDALEGAFGRLTIDHRTILVLHHLEQRPLATIAAVLGIPVGTAKSRLHAARTALEHALEDDR
jgi:RNA polymerase sigma-70 factor (ECF subfamily)